MVIEMYTNLQDVLRKQWVKPLLFGIVALATVIYLFSIRREESVTADNAQQRVQEHEDSAELTAVTDPYIERILASAVQAPRTANTGPVYGINFISSFEDPADDARYQKALDAGVSWNRTPIYWYDIEPNRDDFRWSGQDAIVNADIEHGLSVNAVLMGTPGQYWTHRDGGGVAVPEQLYDPVFTDGTDWPGPDKQLNLNNKWARFVHLTVDRYRPGGILAQAHGWPEGAGYTHWEMWNEPDLDMFWNGTNADYARMLKVGYLAAKHTDPDSTVLFAGIANNFERLDYYDNVLSTFDGDPIAWDNNHFHDIYAMHSYFYSWATWYHIFRTENVLAAHELEKPIWINETGSPIWDDYPGPTWDSNAAIHSTEREAADYIIQSAFYAIYAGADGFFYFQLEDGCGNQPRFTDFPPHSGELCSDGRICAGDVHGLYANGTDAACFSQNPEPERKRETFDAYKVLTQYVTDVQPLWRNRFGGTTAANSPQEWIALYKPLTGERVLAMWSRYGQTTYGAPVALGDSALLIHPNGDVAEITPNEDGVYPLEFPGATNQNAYWDPGLYPIGGRTTILIEKDLTSPTVAFDRINKVDGGTQVFWSHDDGSGKAQGLGVYGCDVWVSVNGNTPALWLNRHPSTSAEFPSSANDDYGFKIICYDRAGNASEPDIIGPFPIVSPTPTYTPTATATATSTPTPTSTPRPTSTPTSTPTQPPTPGPSPTPDPYAIPTVEPLPTATSELLNNTENVYYFPFIAKE